MKVLARSHGAHRGGHTHSRVPSPEGYEADVKVTPYLLYPLDSSVSDEIDAAVSHSYVAKTDTFTSQDRTYYLIRQRSERLLKVLLLPDSNRGLFLQDTTRTSETRGPALTPALPNCTLRRRQRFYA
jgi:hypothetical protein